MYTTRSQEQMQEEFSARRRNVFDALIAGTATIGHWNELPVEIRTALEAGYEVELDYTGSFIIHPKPYLPTPDIEMVDAPWQNPSNYPYTHTCSASHSHTGGVCPVQWPSTLGSLETLRHQLRLVHRVPQNANRFRAFCAIKSWTRSGFGNCSSPLAHELRYDGGCEEERSYRRHQRKVSLDSWKVAPVWERLQKENVEGVSCKRDLVTGNPVLEYVEDDTK
jgi:hypothetical protein